ncbi:MAG: META domain-containing protein [Bacteroidota bacterium]
MRFRNQVNSLLASVIIFTFITGCVTSKKILTPPPPPAPSAQTMLQQAMLRNTWGASQLMGVGLDVENPMVESPSVKFESGGRMTGSTGCNSFMGTYTISGDGVKLDPGAMTRKACEGKQEKQFLEALRRTVNLRLSGERIELVDEKEQVLAQLRPKKP